ncbi:hypothetical protein BCV70DRAFT_92902 [Testicularia cyperi]|uniref:Uncharacterized protein n=1 Tax=Testicularia cyperi TaxID=1882483 RepID=A0A317XHL6_9BASI|nr:hypothetical protein BCV70DRAFT_92902 [Testicularia cyperi]
MQASKSASPPASLSARQSGALYPESSCNMARKNSDPAPSTVRAVLLSECAFSTSAASAGQSATFASNAARSIQHSTAQHATVQNSTGQYFGKEPQSHPLCSYYSELHSSVSSLSIALSSRATINHLHLLHNSIVDRDGNQLLLRACTDFRLCRLLFTHASLSATGCIFTDGSPWPFRDTVASSLVCQVENLSGCLLTSRLTPSVGIPTAR